MITISLMAQGVDLKLNIDSRFYLPLEGRLETQDYDFTGTDSTTSFLSYSSLGQNYVVTLDWKNDLAIIEEWVMDRQVYAPRVMTIDEFLDYMEITYWRQNVWATAKEDAKKKKAGLSFEIPIHFPKGVRDIIGEGGAGLQVTGFRKITLSGHSEWYEGEVMGYGQSKFPSLQMEQESRFTITGTIGSKISVTVDQDSKRETDLENTINIAYTGEEDDVIQKIEAGNTNISLPGATFVGYSERVEGLFGIKSQFQIGDWSITAIASQEKGQHETSTVRGNSSTNPTEIKDYNYLDLTYFWIDSSFIYPWPLFGNNLASGDSIIEFNLYIDNQSSEDNINLNAFEADAMPHPGETYDATIGHHGFFHLVDQDKYEISRTGGWFRMIGYNTLSQNYAIACTYIIRHSDTSEDTVGGAVISGSDTTHYLNLIRPPNMLADNPCWEQTWRNVYSLGSTGLDPENIEVEIYLTPLSNNITSDTTQTPPIPLLEVFGLDKYDDSGNLISDGLVDRQYFHIGEGHLIFPVLHPFSPDDIEDDQMNFGSSTPRNEAMYSSTDNTDITRDHQYIIKMNTGVRQNPMSLGRFNIMDGSEIVKLNGRELQRGVDYRMDYQIGQITFLTEEALNPNTDLTVDFDYEPFFMPDQKSLLGTRAEYQFGENSWIGGTVLYKSTTSAERRPRIGSEPSRSMIWDSDLKLDYEVPFLTKAVDALPLVHTDRESRITFTAEVAEVIGNPNTKGEAYIDDFEGVTNSFSLEVRRTAWHLSSAPDDRGADQDERGRLFWYNPYDRIPVKQIWPNKDVAAEESKTNVLVLDFADTADVGTNSWAGVMRFIQSGYQDQSNSEFLEVWVRGDEGVLHVDLGSINEDINGNGILDSEDKPINDIRDNILTKDEDTGLDGLIDSLEPGYSSSNTDPNNDNWNWDPDNPDDYSKINGTEGNRQDPEGGKKPDTEDLNTNDFLDTYDNYFSFDIDLSSDEFEVQGTRAYIEGTDEYWRLYRIPIKDSVFTLNPDGKVHRRLEIGSPDWQRIKYARLWVDGIRDSSKIWLAAIDLTGNKWEEESSYLEVTTKNTHEDSDYESPPGVTGERSVTTGIMSQEQSLVLKYNDVPGADTVTCFKSTFAGESMDLTLYRELEMWVYLNDEVSDDSVMFFFRLGRDYNNMYEYRTFLKPGWDDDNTVRMDFPTMTAFKDQVLSSYTDEIEGNELGRIDTLDNGALYIIRGSPSLTDVRYFEMGVINPYEFRPISGEIWTDELKVADVRKDPGWAEKSTFKINFADLASIDGSLERKDSEFHTLNEQVGSGATRTIANLSASFNPHKFTPDRWGLSIPVSANIGRTVSVPRLKTGSDISVPDSLRDDETTTIKQYSVNVTEKMRPKAPGLLVGLTLARLSHSISAGETRETSPQYPLNLTQNWSARQSYDLTPANDWNVHLTKWMFNDEKKDDYIEEDTSETDTKSRMSEEKEEESDSIDVPKLLNWQVNLAPTNLKFETNASSRVQTRGDRYGSKTRNSSQTLDHQATLKTNLVKSLTTDSNLKLKRDIGDSAYFHWGHPIVIGDGLSKSITNSVRFNPTILNWLSQSYDVTNSYSEDTDPQRYVDKFGAVTTSRTYRASLGLSWKKFTDFLTGTPSIDSRTPAGRRPTRPDRDRENKEEGEDQDSTFSGIESPSEKSVFRKAASTVKPVFERLDDVQFEWSRDDKRTLPNLADRPSYAFQLAMTTDPGVPTIAGTTGVTSQIESRTITENTTIRTGARLPFNISSSLRYNYRVSEQISTNNTKQTQLSFPDITLNWNGLGQLFFFPKIANNVRTNSHYTHEVKKSYQTGDLLSRTIDDDFSPLASLNMAWKFGLNTEYSSSWKNGMEYRYGTAGAASISKNEQMVHKIIATYGLRASKGIKLPLIGTIQFDNQLSLKLTVQNTRRIVEAWTEGNEEERSTQTDDNEWSITPSASYSFSRNIQGGLEMKWIDTKDNKTDRIHHVRDVSIWVELKF